MTAGLLRHLVTVCKICLLLLSAGCQIVRQDPETGRKTIYLIGYAHLTLPEKEDPANQATAYELTGYGISVGDALKMGVFKEFQVTMHPGSNASVIIVRNKEEFERLKGILSEIKKQGLCIVLKPSAS